MWRQSLLSSLCFLIIRLIDRKRERESPEAIVTVSLCLFLLLCACSAEREGESLLWQLLLSTLCLLLLYA